MSRWARSTVFPTVAKPIVSLAATAGAVAVVSIAASILIGLIANSSVAQSKVDSSAAASHPLLPTCGACHGSDGNAQIPGMPSLAGQPKVFIENQLVMIREGMRPIPQMQGMLDKVTDEDFVLFAKYFSELPVKASAQKADVTKAKRGADIADRALCASCHQKDYSGKEQMPRLAGQREDFLFANMKQFRDGQAVGRDTIMVSTLRGMSDAQLSDLAHYFATMNK
jgi:cytochrome c553